MAAVNLGQVDPDAPQPEKPKTVSGTIGGAKVTTTEANAERLGSAFEPAKKASSSKSSK